MAENFEEQFLLMLVPFDDVSISYYPTGYPKGEMMPIVKATGEYIKEKFGSP